MLTKRQATTVCNQTSRNFTWCSPETKKAVCGGAICLLMGAAAGFGQSTTPPPPPWAVPHGEVLPPYVANGHASGPAPVGLYVAMGDSITFGVGVDPNCAPFPDHPVDVEEFCPTGGSYAVLVAHKLRQAGVAGHFMNIGVGGAHVEDVMKKQLPYLPADAILVTLYIGTNDSRMVKDPKETVQKVTSMYAEHYDELLAAIHAKAPKARIVLINMPNEKYLAAGYKVEASVLPLYDAASQLIDKFIDDHYPNYPIVDTICNPDSYDMSLMSNKSVHPNNEGAAKLASEVIKVILAKQPPAPPRSCMWFQSDQAHAFEDSAIDASSHTEPRQ